MVLPGYELSGHWGCSVPGPPVFWIYQTSGCKYPPDTPCWQEPWIIPARKPPVRRCRFVPIAAPDQNSHEYSTWQCVLSVCSDSSCFPVFEFVILCDDQICFLTLFLDDLMLDTQDLLKEIILFLPASFGPGFLGIKVVPGDE